MFKNSIAMIFLILGICFGFGCENEKRTEIIREVPADVPPVDPPPVDPPPVDPPPVDPPPPNRRQTNLFLPDIERALLNNLDDLNNQQAEEDTRWLIITHRSNAGSAYLDAYRQAMHKALNGISDNDDIILLEKADSAGTAYRLDLDEYGLNAADWDLIVAANQAIVDGVRQGFDFISQTRRGDELIDRTGEDVPWLHADNGIFLAYGDPAVYNVLAKIPDLLDDLIVDLDIDLDRAFDNPFEAMLIGFNGSPISLNKNRLLTRLEQDANNGYFWQTFDPNANFVAEKNLFENPLIEVGVAQFQFDASEVIFELDNGLQKFALFDAAGVRQDEAPLDVVINLGNPFQVEIKNGLDCARCHSGGLIPARDQIRDHVFANASEFVADDVEFVRALYKRNDGASNSRRPTNEAQFAEDNSRYANALSKMGISSSEPDPLNTLTDDHRRDWTLADAAGFIATMAFPTEDANDVEDDFCLKLQGSAVGKAQLGQLCAEPPGTVTLNQFKETFPQLVIDFRLGLDPVDQ